MGGSRPFWFSPRLSLAIRIGIALGGLAFALSRVGLTDLRSSLAEVTLPLVVMGAVLLSGMHLLTAYAWGILLNALGVPLSFVSVSQLYYRGLALAGITPGGIGGDVSRTYLLARNTGTWVSPALSIIISRGLSYGMLILLASGLSVLAPLGSARLPSWLVGALAGSTLFLVMVAVLVILVNVLLQRHLAKWLPDHLRRLMVETNEALALLRGRPIVFLRVLGLLTTFHLGAAGATYLLAMSIQVPMSLVTFLPVIMAFRVVALLPVSIGGGLGVSEVALVVLLEQFGVDSDKALALAVLDRGAWLVTMSIGFVLFLRARRHQA